MYAFDSVRQLISEGEVNKALRLLITTLEPYPEHSKTVQHVRVLESSFQATRQKENSGVISFSDAQIVYNKTSAEILQVLDDISSFKKTSIKRKSWLPIVAGIVLAVVMLGIFIRQGNIQKQLKAQVQCPNFDKKGITVMLLPFNNLGGESSKPELGIQSLIRDLTGRNGILSDVQILETDRFLTNPPDNEEASQLGQRCDAKMVIWGQYEKQPDGISLDVRYIFTEKPDLPPGAMSDTFKNISELKSDTSRFSTISDAVHMLCTAMAIRDGNIELARKWINKVEMPNNRQAHLKKLLSGN